MKSEEFAKGDQVHSLEHNRTTEPSRLAADAAELLDRVVHATLSTVSDAAVSRTSASLREVAQRHPNSPLTVEPVVTDLVKAVLEPRFRQSLEGSKGWELMITCVAQTLFADVAARGRLEALWASLQEASRG